MILLDFLEHKGKYSEMKGHVKNWTDKTYNVVGIDKPGLNGQTTYTFEGLSKGLDKSYF